MKKWMFLSISATLLTPLAASAQSCDTVDLPAPIQSALHHSYASWHLVTRDMFVPDDQKLLDSSKLCPGFVSGHFTSDRVEYAVNLAQEVHGKHFEQVILFNADANQATTIVAPVLSDKWSTLSKAKRGEYKEWDSERRAHVKQDAIVFSVLESSDELFYWDGVKFRSLLLTN